MNFFKKKLLKFVILESWKLIRDGGEVHLGLMEMGWVNSGWVGVELSAREGFGSLRGVKIEGFFNL